MAAAAVVGLAMSISAPAKTNSSFPEAQSTALLQTEAASKSVVAHETTVAYGAHPNFAALTLARNTAANNQTLSFATPLAVLESENGCGYGYIPCGQVCCEAGQQCVQDIVGNPACCPLQASCYGSLTQTVASKTVVYATNTPVNAAGRVYPRVIFGHIMGVVRKVRATIAKSIMAGQTPSRSSAARVVCESGFLPCDGICCLSSQNCTEDSHANFACCDDLNNCAGSASRPPASSAYRLTSFSVIGQAVALTSKVRSDARLPTMTTTSQAHATAFSGTAGIGFHAVHDTEIGKRELQSPFENGGLDPDLNYTALSSASILRSPFNAFGVLRLMCNIFRQSDFNAPVERCPDNQ